MSLFLAFLALAFPRFAEGTITQGAGTTNMRDRIAAVGGTLTVRSAPGDGTCLVGTVPV